MLLSDWLDRQTHKHFLFGRPFLSEKGMMCKMSMSMSAGDHRKSRIGDRSHFDGAECVSWRQSTDSELFQKRKVSINCASRGVIGEATWVRNSSCEQGMASQRGTDDLRAADSTATDENGCYTQDSRIYQESIAFDASTVRCPAWASMLVTWLLWRIAIETNEYWKIVHLPVRSLDEKVRRMIREIEGASMARYLSSILVQGVIFVRNSISIDNTHQKKN